MKALRSIAILVFAFGLSEHAVLCQGIDASNLKGIKVVHVLVEETDQNTCGISDDDVITSVKFIIGQSSIQLSDKSPFHLYVSINSLEGCSASSVSVQVLASVTIIGTGETAVDVPIWEKTGLLAGADQKRRILETVERYCKNMVVDWNSVNHK
jgi:hypothetical protein